MIELKDISKIFTLNKEHKTVALKNVNLTINEGELVVLKGASGSGKSTVLSLIAALSKPTKGEVVVDGKRISKLPDSFASLYRREHIGFIFQKYNLIPNLSVEDNILLPLVPDNLEESFVQKRLQEVMEQFNIHHKKEHLVRSLSGGEQQRVAIARAHVNGPKIIIADEPTANLDKTLSLHFISILKALKGMNKTIIVATHDPLFFDLDFVDRTIDISHGQIQ
jgi:putative ABC transport system ATP-binding protein